MIRLLPIAAIVLALHACAPQLRPAPTAELVAGRARGAAAEHAGVRIEARVEAWRARPLDLDTVVTPVLVTIDNGSDIPIRIRYDEFALVSPDGRRLAALAPFDVDGVLWERVVERPFGRFHHHWFFVARDRLGRQRLVHPFHFDPFFDDFSFFRFAPVRLPTADMVQMALPERVLAPHERVAGFLYFERVGRDLLQLDFTLRLVDNRTGEALARLTIPFVVE